jgi:hypothetical protein
MLQSAPGGCAPNEKFAVTLIILFNALLLIGCGGNSGSTSSTETPNILYVVMDDK